MTPTSSHVSAKCAQTTTFRLRLADGMRPLICAFMGVLVLAASPAVASWRAANSEVEAAARTPRIAAALAAADQLDRAILSHDAKAFSAAFADNAVVNNPFNRIARKADAARNFVTGLIDYASLERTIEYAATRGNHDVVLMGEEALTPVRKARFAGEKIRRRTTEIWTDANGAWKLALRQATIYRLDSPAPSAQAQLAAYSQTEAECYIRQASADWATSVATNDSSVLERILADDFVWVLEGRILNKAQAVAEAAAGPGPFLSNTLDYVNIRFFGDTALAQGRETWRRRSGPVRHGRFIWTDTWLRRNGTWQVVASQDSAIPVEQPAPSGRD